MTTTVIPVSTCNLMIDYIEECEEVICGEWHYGKWPGCDDTSHDVAKDLLDELKGLVA